LRRKCNGCGPVEPVDDAPELEQPTKNEPAARLPSVPRSSLRDIRESRTVSGESCLAKRVINMTLSKLVKMRTFCPLQGGWRKKFLHTSIVSDVSEMNPEPEEKLSGLSFTRFRCTRVGGISSTAASAFSPGRCSRMAE